MGRIVEGLCNFELEKPLSVKSSVSCSSVTWKTIILRAIQMMEAWLGKFGREAKVLLSFCVNNLWFESARAKESAVINKRPEPLK